MAGFRDINQPSHLVICDFQSTGGDKVTYREELKKLAEQLGVSDRVTFLSEYEESAKMEVDQTEIMLFQALCNTFLFPSKSETYSLVSQEAMGMFNLCILNHDFAPLRQIYGVNALYKPFSSNIAMDGYNGTIDTEYSDIDAWFKDLAHAINFYTDHEKTQSGAVFVRTHRNPDYIFRNYMEPLLHREDDNAEIFDSAPGL